MMKVTETKTTEKLFGKATPSAYLELSWEDSPCVDVTGVGLNGFVVAQDLSSGSSWHGGKEKAVSDAIPGNESHELESFNQGRKKRPRNKAGILSSDISARTEPLGWAQPACNHNNKESQPQVKTYQKEVIGNYNRAMWILAANLLLSVIICPMQFAFKTNHARLPTLQSSPSRPSSPTGRMGWRSTCRTAESEEHKLFSLYFIIYVINRSAILINCPY